MQEKYPAVQKFGLGLYIKFPGLKSYPHGFPLTPVAGAGAGGGGA